MPTNWPGLYEEVDRLDLSKRRLHAARAEFDSWARTAEDTVLVAAHATAVSRARELFLRTGLGLTVESRSLPPGRSLAAAPVTLRLGTSRVDLYSVRAEASAPCLHLGVQRGATSTRYPVFTTLPGVLLVRSGNAHFELLALPVQDHVEPARTTVEALVFRAFDLLIGAYRSTLT
jgi:hypothetical protein